MAEAKNCPMCNLTHPATARTCDCGFDFTVWELRGSPQLCQGCGAEGETRKVAFHQHIGAVYLMFHRRVDGRLCKNCVHKHFWGKTITTIVLGWWGFISFFVTPVVILHNIGRYLFCLGMSSPTTPAVGRSAANGSSQPRRSGQLVGLNCARCGERIPSELDGGFCRACSSPVHNGCGRPSEGAGCRVCGSAHVTS